MRRRALLGIVAGTPASLAGCLNPSSGTMTPTATPSFESEVELTPCPNHPSQLTEESVGAFVEQFERAYIARRVLARVERVTSFDFLSLDVESVMEKKDGYRVVVSGFYGYAFYRSATSEDDTHADIMYTATYFVSAEEVFRIEESEGDAKPRSDGEQVHCPLQG